MRALPFLALLLQPCMAKAQPDTLAARPLVLQESIGLQLSKAQVYAAALDAWDFTFGQEPGGKIELQDVGNGLLEGVARLNYRGTSLAAREETMGVIVYHVTVQADNGQCLLRIAQVTHTGNREATDGGIDIGPIYSGDRPMTRIAGISLGTAQKLHADMRTQVTVRIQKVMNAFSARMRAAQSTTK